MISARAVADFIVNTSFNDYTFSGNYIDYNGDIETILFHKNDLFDRGEITFVNSAVSIEDLQLSRSTSEFENLRDGVLSKLDPDASVSDIPAYAQISSEASGGSSNSQFIPVQTVRNISNGAEDSSTQFDVSDLLQGFSDAESATVDLSIAGLSANTGNITGTPETGFTFTPEADFNGEVTFNYVVVDPDGGKTLATKSFTIESVNDRPEFKASEPITLANIQEDSELVFTEAQLLNGFSDRDGDPLYVTGLTVTTANAGVIDGDYYSGFTFTANPNYNGPVELTYSVTDGTESTIATASFNVLSVNDAPELNSTSAVIDLGSVEEDLGYKGDEEDIIDQGTAALGLNPFVITEEQLLANFTDADDAIADLSRRQSDR